MSFKITCVSLEHAIFKEGLTSTAIWRRLVKLRVSGKAETSLINGARSRTNYTAPTSEDVLAV